MKHGFFNTKQCMLPITPEEFNEVACQIGFAVLQIQVLEQALAVHLVLVHKVSVEMARSEIEKLFLKTEKRTLGQLFKDIHDTNRATPTLLLRLESFVKERNWLIHRCRHENRTDFYSEVKRTVLIRRIGAIAEESLALQKAFQKATEDHSIAQGISRVEIETRAAKIYQDWSKAN